jgi:hypothetical protein
LAGYAVDRYPQVLKYPAGEALAAYQHLLREQARREYELSCQIWAALAATGATKQRKPPELPAILKE